MNDEEWQVGRVRPKGLAIMKKLCGVLPFIVLFVGVLRADECRDLAHAKRAHVFVITDSDGPVYGYAELYDPMRAWESTKENWTATIQGSSVEDVRANLAKLMRSNTVSHPSPPLIVPCKIGLFEPMIDWGNREQTRKSIYNVSEWAPPAKNVAWKRTWSLPSTRD